MNAATRRSFTIKKKLKVVQLAQSTSIRNTAILYKLDRKSVRKWIQQEKELKDNLHGEMKRLPGGGRQVPYASMEKELVAWIEDERSKGLRISRK